jgi:acetyl esterase/lipase
MESAFCRTYHCYATSLAASAGALVISLEYRLASEHPIPAAYDDAWSELKWVASLADPWLADYADPARAFLAGDSAGGNIAYHTAVRASRDSGMGVDIEGMVIVHPYFWGPNDCIQRRSGMAQQCFRHTGWTGSGHS